MKVYCVRFWNEKIFFIGPEVSKEEWEQICDIAMRGAAEKELQRARSNLSFFRMSNLPETVMSILKDSGFERAEETDVWYDLGMSVRPRNKIYKVLGSELGDSIIAHDKKMWPQSQYQYTDS